MIVPSRVWPVAALLASLPLAAVLAEDGPPVPVRIGSHPGFGRVVFDLPAHTDYRLTQQGEHVVVQFTGGVTIGPSPKLPRNVVGITGGAGQAEFDVAPGTVVHDWLSGSHVVIDVWDKGASGAPTTAKLSAAQVQPQVGAPHPTQAAPPAKAAATSVAPSPLKAAATPAAPPPVAPLKPGPVPLMPGPKPTPISVPPPASPPVAPQGQTSPPASPDASSATRAIQSPPAVPTPQPAPTSQPSMAAPADAAADTAAQPAAKPDPALEVPFDTPGGVAAFRRGNVALVVFDQPRKVDTAQLRDDPVFGTATVQNLPSATVISVRLEAGMALSLSQSAKAWRITAVPTAPMLRPILISTTDDRLVLNAAAPGAVVSLTDPDTGAILLVGTQQRQGQGIAVRRRSVQFALLPTWQGVVVEAIADTLALRPVQDGFVLTGGPNGLAMSPASNVADLLMHATGLTRQFEFPDQPNMELMQLLRRQVTEDATTPQLARGPRREAVARTMISLGLGAEAQAVLQVAADDDPHQAASPDNAALASIAALLAHRPTEAAGLNDPRLPRADDVSLWSAIRVAELQDGSAAAAAVFTATLPLLLTYPSEIRNRLLPLVAETLVAGGEITTATALLDARKDDLTLDLARGMLQEAKGDNTAALKIYDRLAQSRNQALHARSAVLAVNLRLASGGIDARQAADRLDKLLYAWRGDRHERLLREHLADLRARTGAWRSALNLLRETEALFPEEKAAIHAELTDMFADLLRGNAADAMAPLELVALAEENTDLLPEGAEGDALQTRLADRLLALDLPKRAEPVLEKLMQAAPTGVGRATFGARLAALRLRETDVAGAFAALSASAETDLPPELVERRTLLLAAAHARHGDTDHALAALGSLGTAAADEARAVIQERVNDWPAAQKALADYAAKTVPPEGKLDDGQRRTLLRLATAAARAGDEAALTALRQREGARMQSGPLADMFRLLTADRVRSVADLKRSGQEAILARGLPSQLKALQPPPQQTQ